MTATEQQTALVDTQRMMQSLSSDRRSSLGTVIPSNATRVTRFGALVVPDYGTQGLILAYTIPVNMEGLFDGLVLGFAGQSPQPNPGDVIFTVDVDLPLGATDGGYTEAFYGSVPFALGSFSQLTWPIEFKHKTGETIRIKGTPVQNIATGNGSFLTAALVGWVWPAEGRG